RSRNTSMHVTTKTTICIRFRGIGRDTPRAAARSFASVLRLAARHSPAHSRGSGWRAGAHTRWQTGCKTYSVCKKYSLVRGCEARAFLFYRDVVGLGQRQTRNRAPNYFLGRSARAEAYWLVKRCCPVGMERGRRRVVRLAIECGVRRTPMRAAY